MLKQKPRMQRKRVKALTDPKPEFVSLVGAGANKTPFRAMRSDQTQQEYNDSEEVASKSELYAVARIEFDAEQFADEATVSSWLADGGYEGATIEKTDNGFVVSGEEIPGDAPTHEIEGNGFKMIVTDVPPGATAQKSDEGSVLSQKYHECCEPVCSSYCDGTTVADVLSWRATPGLMDMTMALYDAMRNNLREGDKAGAKAAITEFSGLFDKLMDIFPGKETPAYKAFVDAMAPEVEMTKETETAAKAEDQNVEAPGTEATVEKTEENTENVKAEDEDEAPVEKAAEGEKAEDENVEAAAEEKTAEKGSEENSTDEEGAEEASKTDAEEKQDDPIAALTAMVGTLAESVKEMGETVAAKTDELAQRVAAVEDVRQTRKGADVDEATTSEPKQKSVSDEMSEMRTKSMLGIRG